jgi:hypothetical protein
LYLPLYPDLDTLREAVFEAIDMNLTEGDEIHKRSISYVHEYLDAIDSDSDGPESVQIDVLRKHIILNGYDANSGEIKWLMEVLKGLTQPQLRRFIYFITHDPDGSLDNAYIKITRWDHPISRTILHTDSSNRTLYLPRCQDLDSLRKAVNDAIYSDLTEGDEIHARCILHLRVELCMTDSDPDDSDPDNPETINVRDLEKHIQLEGYDPQSDEIQWLMEVLEELDSSDLRLFIYFITHDPKISLDKDIKITRWDHPIPNLILHTDSLNRRLYLSRFPDSDTLREAVLEAIDTDLTEGDEIHARGLSFLQKHEQATLLHFDNAPEINTADPHREFADPTEPDFSGGPHH